MQQTTCCVVGGGPGGAVLALMLARKGVAVTLLEAHGDFDRDFRGDTLHPSVMENMDELGLADRLLAASPLQGARDHLRVRWDFRSVRRLPAPEDRLSRTSQ